MDNFKEDNQHIPYLTEARLAAIVLKIILYIFSSGFIWCKLERDLFVFFHILAFLYTCTMYIFLMLLQIKLINLNNILVNRAPQTTPVITSIEAYGNT